MWWQKGVYPMVDGLPVIDEALGSAPEAAGAAGGEGPDLLHLAPGSRVPTSLVGMVEQLAQRLPTEVHVTGFSLQYTAQYGVVVASAAGWQARFGGPEWLDLKIAELRSILHLVQAQGQHVALIDLRYGSHPYYRLSP